MPRVIRKWAIELLILLLYKHIFENFFLKEYMGIYSYLYNGITYTYNSTKMIITSTVFLTLSLLLIDTKPKKNNIYSVLIRFIFCICVIPMLSVCAFFQGIDLYNIFYPVVFYTILIVILKGYSVNSNTEEKALLSLPSLKNVEFTI